MREFAISLQALVAASVFFVWVVRYGNIVEEFRHYQLPDWLRDLVGILKLTFALMLLLGVERPFFAIVGGVGIAFLMVGAFASHLRVGSPIHKMLPCLLLFACAVIIAWLNAHHLRGG